MTSSLYYATNPRTYDFNMIDPSSGRRRDRHILELVRQIKEIRRGIDIIFMDGSSTSLMFLLDSYILFYSYPCVSVETYLQPLTIITVIYVLYVYRRLLNKKSC